jgi:enterochelin esterase-like enzyme
MTSLGRRTLLTAAGLAVVAGCSPDPLVADRGGVPPERFASGWFRSTHMRGARVGWSIAYPPGERVGGALPVVVVLHARGASHRTAFDVLHLGAALDSVVGRGVPPFAVASVDGGDHGYWHGRADGSDAGAMVVDDFVPLLRSRKLDTDRLGLLGWSMGGYGALLLAGRHRLPVRTVAVASPALFTTAGNTPPGAFDNAADYVRNDVYSHPDRLAGLPLRVDCGRSDPFYLATRDFVSRLRPRPAGSFGVGGHDPAYWRRMAPAELAFVGRHL